METLEPILTWVLYYVEPTIQNSGVALGISINGFTSPQESYCILILGFPKQGSGNPRVHQQRFWISTGSQEPEEPVLTQPLKLTFDAEGFLFTL